MVFDLCCILFSNNTAKGMVVGSFVSTKPANEIYSSMQKCSVRVENLHQERRLNASFKIYNYLGYYIQNMSALL